MYCHGVNEQLQNTHSIWAGVAHSGSDASASDDDSVIYTQCNQLPAPPVISSGTSRRRQPDVFTGELPPSLVIGSCSSSPKQSSPFGSPETRTAVSAVFSRAMDHRPNPSPHQTVSDGTHHRCQHSSTTSSCDGANSIAQCSRSYEDTSSASCSLSWKSSPSLLSPVGGLRSARTSHTWSGATSYSEQYSKCSARPSLRIIPPADNDCCADDAPLAQSCPSRVSTEMKLRNGSRPSRRISCSPTETVTGWVQLPQIYSPNSKQTTSAVSPRKDQGSSCTANNDYAQRKREGVRFSIEQCSVSLPLIDSDKLGSSRPSRDFSSFPKSDPEKRRVSIGEQVAEYATRLNREGKFSGSTVCPKWVAQHAFEYALTNPTNFRV